MIMDFVKKFVTKFFTTALLGIRHIVGFHDLTIVLDSAVSVQFCELYHTPYISEKSCYERE